MTSTAWTSDPADFSLVLGGPLYQIWRRTGLAGDALQLLHRRLVSLTVLAWVPLLAFSIAEGHAWGGAGLPFLKAWSSTPSSYWRCRCSSWLN